MHASLGEDTLLFTFDLFFDSILASRRSISSRWVARLFSFPEDLISIEYHLSVLIACSKLFMILRLAARRGRRATGNEYFNDKMSVFLPSYHLEHTILITDARCMDANEVFLFFFS